MQHGLEKKNPSENVLVNVKTLSSIVLFIMHLFNKLVRLQAQEMQTF